MYENQFAVARELLQAGQNPTFSFSPLPPILPKLWRFILGSPAFRWDQVINNNHPHTPIEPYFLNYFS
jgi:hypothetical protein